MGKRVNEFTPTNIYLSNLAVETALQNFQNQERARSTFNVYISLLVALIPNLIGYIISFAGAFSALGQEWRTGFIILMVIFGIVILILGILAIRQTTLFPRKRLDIEQLLLNETQENTQYTAIMRITTRIDGEMKYLVGADYFLPHCSMVREATLHEQENNLLQSLHDAFGILEKDIVKFTLLEDSIQYRIKPIHGDTKMNGYAFYDVEIKIQARNGILSNRDGRRWISLNEMKASADACATNKDVIDLLDNYLSKPKDSFVNLLGNINIIWNITSLCKYNCAICATYDDSRRELSAQEKLAVLNNITTASAYIKTLDFAGGDPLESDEVMNIIQSAISQLGSDKISITTTGAGIEKLNSGEFSFHNLIKHSEITIDAAHSNLQEGTVSSSEISRNEDDYCKANIDQIQILLKHTESLTINIPIVNDDLSDGEIGVLVDKICYIRDRNPSVEIDTVLIRLMPVGRLGKDTNQEIYRKYNPVETVNKIRTQLEKKNIPCKLHCSLRILPCFQGGQCSEYCTMMESKLGIDCEGNVFACAWGGYLPKVAPKQNPFYLGNLTKRRLNDILDAVSQTPQYTKILSEITSKQHRNFCSVVSYYANKQAFQNFDYLSKK